MTVRRENNPVNPPIPLIPAQTIMTPEEERQRKNRFTFYMNFLSCVSSFRPDSYRDGVGIGWENRY